MQPFKPRPIPKEGSPAWAPFQDLRKRIETGELPPGTDIGTARHLAEHRYHCEVHQVIHAIQALRTLGYLETGYGATPTRVIGVPGGLTLASLDARLTAIEKLLKQMQPKGA